MTRVTVPIGARINNNAFDPRVDVKVETTELAREVERMVSSIEGMRIGDT